MVAAQRAKDIASGSPLTLPRDNDKNTVVALREIADGTVSVEELQKSLVMGLQKYVEVEEPEEEEMEIMAAEKELADLDDQFSGVLLDNEMSDAMQVRDDDDIDLDSEVDAGADDDVDDDALDMGDDMGDDFGADDLNDEE